MFVCLCHGFTDTQIKRAIEQGAIQRILFLRGLPNLQDLGKLLIGESSKEVLACDLEMEQGAVVDLRAAVSHAEEVKDYVSREIERWELTQV